MKSNLPIWQQVTLGVVIAGTSLTAIQFARDWSYTIMALNTLEAMFIPFTNELKKSEPIPRQALTYSPIIYNTTAPLRENGPASHPDYPPNEHPSKWDYIKNADKVCWYHKQTRAKVCEPA